MVVEGRGLSPYRGPLDEARCLHVSAVLRIGRIRVATIDAVGMVRRQPSVNCGLMHAIAQHVVDRTMRPVDRQLAKIRAAEASQLGVQVGEQSRLHQRIIRGLDPRYEVAGVEGDLFGFGEVVGGVAVQGQFADQLNRREFLRHQLGRVEQVNALEAVAAVVGQYLDAQLVFEEGARLDPVGHVAAVKVRVTAGGNLRFLPHQRMHAGRGFPVELDQARLACGVDEPEGVDAEAFHRPIRARDAAVAHVPEHVMGGLGMQRHEIPEGVVGGLCLGYLAIGLRFCGVDDVGEFDAVLDEEHGHVVADQVEVAFFGIELHREAACIANCIGRAP